jgi:phage terminase large subunit
MPVKDIKTTNVFWRNKEAYESKQYRAIINQGSTRSSKTYSLCQLIPSIALAEKKEITVCSPSLPHLKRGARKDFLDIIKDWGVYNDKDFNKTDNIYRFPQTGSYIEFFGADETNKLRGPGRDILYVNEINLLPRESYIQLALRTRDVIFGDLNPADEYSYVYDIADEPGNKLIHSTYKDNLANLTKGQIDEIENLKDADENLWKVFGLGLRGTSTETIYTHWKPVDHMPECDEFVYGLDFGYNNPSALVKVGIKDGRLYAEEIMYETKLTTNDLVYVVETFGIGKCVIYCDAAEPKTIEELSRAGLNVKSSVKAVKEGISMVKSKPLFVTSNSVNLIKEIKNYKWKTDNNGKVLDEPVKFMDHLLDAMRYAVYTHFTQPSFEFIFV